MNFFGRRIIMTSCLPKCLQPENYCGDTLNDNTVRDEVNKALNIHRLNANECNQLEMIFRGNQEILKRSSVDRIVNNKVVINYAQAFTRDIIGYTFSNGVNYVATQDKDMAEVQKLNQMMKCENKQVFDLTKNETQSIMGTSYLSIFPDFSEKNEVPFEISEISPTDAFVAYSTLNRTVPVYSWNVYKIRNKTENLFIHQVFTRSHKWFFKSKSRYYLDRDYYETKDHILKDVPIIEFPNNQYRLGDWECAISIFNAINNLASDSINDVEQTVKSYLALFGVELDEVALKDMKKHRIMSFRGTAGINQDAKFITAQIDGSSAQLLRSYLEQALKVVVGIPDRDVGQTGSDTGTSAYTRTGSGDMEIIANNKTIYTSMSERRLIRIALNILQPQYISESLTVRDIDISIPRNKLTDIVSKTQAGSTAYAMGMAKTDVLKIMDITNDIIGMTQRWNESEKQMPKESAALQ